MPTDTRRVRYYGNYQLTPAQRKSKELSVYVVIVRPQASQYLSTKSNPEEGFFGKVTYLRDDYVVDVSPLEYQKQRVYYWANATAYLQQAVSCTHESVLTTFVNLFTALGLVPIQRNNPIKDWDNPQVPFDKIAVKLLTEPMIADIIVQWSAQETCEVPLSEPPEYSDEPIPPPPDTEPFDLPDDQFEPISQPYDGRDDDGFTYKPEENDTPVGGLCELITVEAVIEEDLFSTGNFFRETLTKTVYGPVLAVRVIDNLSPRVGVVIDAFGDASVQECQNEYVEVPLRRYENTGLNAQMRVISWRVL